MKAHDHDRSAEPHRRKRIGVQAGPHIFSEQGHIFPQIEFRPQFVDCGLAASIPLLRREAGCNQDASVCFARAGTGAPHQLKQ